VCCRRQANVSIRSVHRLSPLFVRCDSVRTKSRRRAAPARALNVLGQDRQGRESQSSLTPKIRRSNGANVRSPRARQSAKGRSRHGRAAFAYVTFSSRNAHHIPRTEPATSRGSCGHGVYYSPPVPFPTGGRRRTHAFGDLDPQYIPRDVGKADFKVCVVEPKSM